MAFELSKLLKNDYVAGYATITRITIDFPNKQSSLNMSFYKEKSSYETFKEPVEVKTFEFNGDDFIFQTVALKNASPLDLAYQELVTHPEFVGAVIVPDVEPR